MLKPVLTQDCIHCMVCKVLVLAALIWSILTQRRGTLCGLHAAVRRVGWEILCGERPVKSVFLTQYVQKQNTLVGLILQERCTIKALWCISYCFFIAYKEEIVSAPYIQRLMLESFVMYYEQISDHCVVTMSFYSGDQMSVSLTKQNFRLSLKKARHTAFLTLNWVESTFFPASIT